MSNEIDELRERLESLEKDCTDHESTMHACIQVIGQRLEKLEAHRETERAAALDLYKQLDELKARIDRHYLRIRALEGDATDEPPQTLHTIALDMVDSLGRSFNLLPEILDTIRRAIREPMEPAPAPAIEPPDISEQSKPPLGLRPMWLAREHRRREICDAINRYEAAGKAIPHEWREELESLTSPPAIEPPELSDEECERLWLALTLEDWHLDGIRHIYRTGWDAALAAVAQQQPAPPATATEPTFTPEEAEMIAAPWSLLTPEPAPAPPAPAPAGSLVEVVVEEICHITGDHPDDYVARGVIRAVAEWLDSVGNNGSAADLRKEADR